MSLSLFNAPGSIGGFANEVFSGAGMKNIVPVAAKTSWLAGPGGMVAGAVGTALLSKLLAGKQDASPTPVASLPEVQIAPSPLMPVDTSAMMAAGAGRMPAASGGMDWTRYMDDLLKGAV